MSVSNAVERELVITRLLDAPHDRVFETLITVTFADRAGRTELIMRQGVPEPLAARHQAVEGWNQSFDRLNQFLERSAP